MQKVTEVVLLRMKKKEHEGEVQVNLSRCNCQKVTKIAGLGRCGATGFQTLFDGPTST